MSGTRRSPASQSPPLASVSTALLSSIAHSLSVIAEHARSIAHGDSLRNRGANEAFVRLIESLRQENKQLSDNNKTLSRELAKARRAMRYDPNFDEECVSFFDLSLRAENVIASRGIRYVGELVGLSAQDLLLTKNCGRRTIKEIESALRFRGLELGMDVGGWNKPL